MINAKSCFGLTPISFIAVGSLDDAEEGHCYFRILARVGIPCNDHSHNI